MAKPNFFSSNFAVNGLGFGNSPNIELNLIVQDKRDLDDLKRWFDQAWQSKKSEDVKGAHVEYLRLICHDHSPEFLCFKTKPMARRSRRDADLAPYRDGLARRSPRLDQNGRNQNGARERALFSVQASS